MLACGRNYTVGWGISTASSMGKAMITQEGTG